MDNVCCGNVVMMTQFADVSVSHVPHEAVVLHDIISNLPKLFSIATLMESGGTLIC